MRSNSSMEEKVPNLKTRLTGERCNQPTVTKN